MGSLPKKRTTVRERELTERIRELEEKLAASVPRTEFETVKSNLQLEISDLKTKLSVAEDHASRELSEPVAGGQFAEDGFEEGEKESFTAETMQMGSSEDIPSEEPEESETKDSEDEEKR